jgi:predicted negative regulator of RcsB-dependent stress response
MSEEPQALKGDRLIEWLERIQHWISENYKFLIAMFIVFLAVALGAQYVKDQKKAEEKSYWELAAKAEDKTARQKFLATYSDSAAAKLVSMELARTHLDDGEYAEAETVLTQFLSKSGDHSYAPLAHLLRAYAREDLGKTSEALTDYQAALEDKRFSLLAQAGLDRLK